MRTFWYLLLAHLREFSRDPMTLVWTAVFPIMITLLSGLVFYDETLVFPVGVVNDAGTAGEGLIAALDASDVLDVTVGDLDTERDALASGNRRAVIVIPADVAAPPVQITVLYDPSHQNAALVLGLLQQTITGAYAQMASEPPAAALAPQAIDAPEFRRIDYMLPGILAMALMQLGVMVTAVQVVIERERQVLRRIGLAPVSRATMIAADVAFRLVVGLGQLVVIALLGCVLYGVPVQWDRALSVVGLTLLGGAGFLTFGYVLAGLARTEESINALVGLPNVVMMMLSGILFPVDDMTGWVQTLASLLPITYLGDALRCQMIGFNSLYDLQTDVLVLGGWLIGCVLLAVRLFKWEPQT